MTVRNYLDILSGAFMVRQLQPWFENIGKRYEIELKLNEAPEVTRSMYIALEDLGLEHLWIVCPGAHNYPIRDRITACALQNVGNLFRTQ